MSIFLARGQPPTGDGSFPNGPANSNTSDSGSLLSDQNSWWWSATAEAIKTGIIAGIIILFGFGIVGAYIHAKRRIKKGLPPLSYHRWLVRRHQQRSQFTPRDQNNFSFYGQREDYNMHPYAAAPPPAYNAEHDYVPPYTPPAEGSKIKVKDETTLEATENGPSHPPAVANPSRPTYS